ncbi:hypothetical protein ACHAXT_010916 [Thalassiosira profunda]
MTALLPAAAALSFAGHSLVNAVADEPGGPLRRGDEGVGGVATSAAHFDFGGSNDEPDDYHRSRHRPHHHRRRLQKSRQGPPRNDDCAAALPVRALPFSYAGSTAGATADFDGPSCGAFRYANGVWFSYTPDESGVLTAEGDGAGVRVYSGSCANLACVSQYDASHDFVAVAGVEYFFLVSRVSFSQGTEFEFALLQEGETRPPVAPSTPSPVETRPPVSAPNPDPTEPPARTRPPNAFVPTTGRPTPRPTMAMETKAPTPRPSPGPTRRPSRKPTRRPIATPGPTEDSPDCDEPPAWNNDENEENEWSDVEAALVGFASQHSGSDDHDYNGGGGKGSKAAKFFKSQKTGKLFKPSCKSGKNGIQGKAGKGSKSSKGSKGVSGKSWKGGWGGSQEGYYLSRLEQRGQALANDGRVEGSGDGHMMGERVSVTHAMGAAAAVVLMLFVGAKFGAVEYRRRRREVLERELDEVNEADAVERG